MTVCMRVGLSVGDSVYESRCRRVSRLGARVGVGARA